MISQLEWIMWFLKSPHWHTHIYTRKNCHPGESWPFSISCDLENIKWHYAEGVFWLQSCAVGGCGVQVSGLWRVAKLGKRSFFLGGGLGGWQYFNHLSYKESPPALGGPTILLLFSQHLSKGKDVSAAQMCIGNHALQKATKHESSTKPCDLAGGASWPMRRPWSPLL